MDLIRFSPVRQPLLSIVTLTLPERRTTMDLLRRQLWEQIGSSPVEHLVWTDPFLTYGECMRASLASACGDYVAYVDDDDWIAAGYVEKILAALNSRPDVVTFGWHTKEGKKVWLRANRPPEQMTLEGIVRCANHYCAWHHDIARQSVWLPRSYGAEDVWCRLLQAAHPNLHEFHIHELLYIYRYDPRVTRCQDQAAISSSLADGGARILGYRHMDGRLLAGKNLGELYDAQGEVGDYDPADLTQLIEVIYC